MEIVQADGMHSIKRGCSLLRNPASSACRGGLCGRGSLIAASQVFLRVLNDVWPLPQSMGPTQSGPEAMALLGFTRETGRSKKNVDMPIQA